MGWRRQGRVVDVGGKDGLEEGGYVIGRVQAIQERSEDRTASGTSGLLNIPRETAYPAIGTGVPSPDICLRCACHTSATVSLPTWGDSVSGMRPEDPADLGPEAPDA